MVILRLLGIAIKLHIIIIAEKYHDMHGQYYYELLVFKIYPKLVQLCNNVAHY